MSTPSAFLSEHVAVRNHGRGVGSENLANFVEAFADQAKARILGTGNLQYNLDETGLQRFEELSGEQLADELLDELLDVVNYCSMIAIKVLALRNGMPPRT